MVGANAEHRLGCVCVGGLRNGGGLFAPKLPQFQSFQHSTLPPRSATPQAGPQQLFVNRRPFHADVNPQIPSRALLLPSGETGKCTLLGLILRPEVELDTSVSACAPVGRAPFGELGPCVSRLKSQSVSQQMMTAGCKTMVEPAEGAKSPFSCAAPRRDSD